MASLTTTMACLLESKYLWSRSRELLQISTYRSAHRAHSSRSFVPSPKKIKITRDSTVPFNKQLISTAASPNRLRSVSKTVSNPVAWYANKLETHPLITKCLTAAFIAGSGDLVCQYVSHNRKYSTVDRDYYLGPDESFDPDMKRTGRFAIVGMSFVAPMCHHWFRFLHKHVSGQTLFSALKRVVIDQIFFAPIVIPGVMTNIMLLEGRALPEIKDALKRDVPDAYVTNLAVWVPALLINFKYIPSKWQVLFSNCVGFGWNFYLSWKTQEASAKCQ